MPSNDVVVIGLGAAGAAVTYHLARRGTRVLGIDRFAPPHSFGSTHGDTRITRQAIGEGSAYVPLAMRAHALWRDLEHESGERLLTATGCLVLGDPSRASTAHGVTDFVASTVAAARESCIDHEVLDGSTLRRRYPQFRTGSGEIGYFEPGAGYLRPERGVRVQLELAARHGAIIHTGERVLSCAPEGDGVLVTTDSGAYRAPRAVIAAGPWVHQLIDTATARVFSVQRQVMPWWDVGAAHDRFAPEAFPVFIWDRGGSSLLFGFPALDGPGGGIKVALERFGTPVDPETAPRSVGARELEAMHRDGVRDRLPGVGPRSLRAMTCLYTCTPDFGFVIDALPECPAATLVSACSGHGFKHTPAVGEAVAQQLLDGRSDLDLSAFNLSRFPSV